MSCENNRQTMIVSLIQGTAHFSNIKNKGKIKSSIRFLLAQRYFFVRDFSPGEVEILY